MGYRTWPNLFRLSPARAKVAEGFRHGIIAEFDLIDLSRPRMEKESVGHDVGQGVEIGVGETGLALQSIAGPIVSRANARNAARSKPICIWKKIDTKNIVK